MKGAASAMQREDYRLVFADTRNSSVTEAREFERHCRLRIDGFIVWAADLDPNFELFKRMLYTGPPLVMIDRFFDDVPTDHVVTDNFWGAYEATSLLIERGHRRIAHFNTLISFNSALADRRAGYEQALIDHGIPVDTGLICPPMAYGEAVSVMHTFAYLRQLPDPITAVFTVNDLHAWATYRAARDLGLQVPKDIEIASFFDERGIEEGSDVPFIRVVQPSYEIGLAAGKMLLDRLDGLGGPDPIRISLKPTLVDAGQRMPLSRAANDETNWQRTDDTDIDPPTD